MEQIILNQKEYIFIKNFQKKEHIRKSYNELTQKIYGFDLEGWYQNGYWGDNYQPYSLMKGDRLVANVSVSHMDFLIMDEKRHLLQIGTVMTDPQYRNRGLSRYLMERILTDHQEYRDSMYLFANDGVLNFYPGFGFQAYYEYQYEKDIINHNPIIWAQKLDMDLAANKIFVQDKIRNAHPVSKLSMVNNSELVMFHITSFRKENVYYIHELDTVTIAEYQDDTLFLQDIYSAVEINLDEVTDAMSNCSIKKVVLGFTPKDTQDYSIALRREKNTTLFVRKELSGLFQNYKMMFPVLSRA